MRDREFEALAVEADPFGEIGRGRPEEWGVIRPADEVRLVPETAQQYDDMKAVANALRVFNNDEVAVLRHVADRLMLGRERYKPLDLRADDRDWKKEMDEEVLDLVIYDSFRYLKSRL